MPEFRITTPADRYQGVLDGMHPELNGDLINTPDDLMRGKGNFKPGPDGNPEGFLLIPPEQIIARKLYMGAGPNKVTEQIKLPVQEGSFLLNTLIADGDEPPEQFIETSLPKPPKPTIVKSKAEVAGYPETTLERPLWLTYAYRRGSVFTEWARGVLVPPLSHGQSIRFTLPDSIPAGVNGIGVALTPPGQSTATTHAQYRLQRVFEMPLYLGVTVEINGPYVWDTTVPGDTSLPAPGTPDVRFWRERNKAKPGIYRFCATLVNELGEGLPGTMAGPFTVDIDPYWGGVEAGYGAFHLSTSHFATKGAWGFYIYVQRDGRWNRVYNTITGEGLVKPFPPGYPDFSCSGWDSPDEMARAETFVLNSSELPTENTSGIATPDSPLEAPTVFGASRPVGRIYVRASELTESEESPLSDAAEADLAQDEVANIVFANRVNQLANATFILKGADGLPISYTVSGSGTVDAEDGELIITGTTIEVTADPVVIDRLKDWGVGALLALKDPHTGTFGGTFQVILREIGVSTSTDTVLKSLTTKGEHYYHETISPSGYGSTFAWKPDTTKAQIVYKFSGISNMTVHVSRQILADYLYSFRRREEIVGVYSNPNPTAPTTAPPSGSVALEPSPTPEVSPETLEQIGPDRPISGGVVKESVTFETGMPSWTQVSQNATLAREVGAAISGSFGLASRKTSGGSSGKAFIWQSYLPDTGLEQRSSLGLASQHRFPTLPSNGSITLRELRRGDGQRFVWIDLDTRYEVSQLEISGDPVSSGNITTTLDENGVMVPRSTSVIAAKEKATLNIAGLPTADGQVAVTVGQTTIDIPVSAGIVAQKAVVKVEITRGALRSGFLNLVLGAPQPNPRNLSASGIDTSVGAGDTPEIVARKLRDYANQSSWQYDLWTISGDGKYVIFTAKIAAPTNTTAYPPGNVFWANVGGTDTGVGAQITVLTQGRIGLQSDTTESIATRVREASFPGYKTASTSNTSEVEFEALEPGVRPDASFNPRSTGVVATMTTNTQGSRDTREDVAQKVVNTYSGNSYVSASRSGDIVTFSHTSGGPKQNATFSAGTTQTVGNMTIVSNGGNEIVLYAKDSFGDIRKRHILDGITATTLVNLDLAALGAGRPKEPSGDSLAIVLAWASTGSDPMKLQGLFEGLSLEDYESSVAAIGVTEESSTSLTWEVHTDNIEVTDRGKTYYRYHAYSGELVNQAHLFLPPGYKPVDGLFLQGYAQAILPDTEYTASVFVRWAGLKHHAEPFYMYCVTPLGDVRPIGCITEQEIAPVLPPELPEGIVPSPTEAEAFPNTVIGDGGWTEFTRTFTTPSDCYELRLQSRRIGEGEIVCQELAISLGDEIKRTNLYSTEGSYIALLPLATPRLSPLITFYSSFGRERKLLETDIEAPDGTTATVGYRSSDYEVGPFGSAVSSPDLVEQKDFIRVDITTATDGKKPVVVRSGTPSAEYVLRIGSDELATFLKPDRTEFEGGAFFGLTFDRPAEPPEMVTTRLPGGRLSQIPTYGPVGDLAPFELQVFTPEAKKYIEDRAELVDFHIEARDQIWRIRFRGPVRFTSDYPERKSNGKWYGYWIAKCPGAWVKEIRDLPA